MFRVKKPSWYNFRNAGKEHPTSIVRPKCIVDDLEIKTTVEKWIAALYRFL